MEAAINGRFRRFVDNDGDENGASKKSERIEELVHL